MARLKEPLSGGLKTGPDPADLGPGELSSLQNAVYKPASEALYRARGREFYASASAAALDVNGLRDLHFDNGSHFLVAHASSNYTYTWVTAAAPNAASAMLSSAVGVGSQLERIHYRNRFYLMNGVTSLPETIGSNRVAYLSATAVGTVPSLRQHGMIPVTAAPSVVTAGAGTYSQEAVGYYEYWTTEVAKYQQDGVDYYLESAFSGTPTTVHIAALTTVPTIYMPTVRNTGLTTHWRIYRSAGKKDSESDPTIFPDGFLVGNDLPITTVSAADSGAATLNGPFAMASANNGVGEFAADFTNAGNVYTDDTNYASITMPAASTTKRQGWYKATFTGITGNISGITVTILAYVSGSDPVPITVSIGPRDDGSLLGIPGYFRGGGQYTQGRGQFADRVGGRDFYISKSGLVVAHAAADMATYPIVLGGSSDRWWPSTYPGFSSSDFSQSFMVMIECSSPSVTLYVDYITVTVHSGATPKGDSTVQFPAVVYEFGDQSAKVAKNGQPPSSSTGDIYQDTLVCNDVSSPKKLAYSFPEEPESFPGTYYINFETEDNDIIRCIKVVNARLVVGLDTSLWRVNYLPSERDASFDRGKAIEPITRSFGIVNPMCACVFSPDGSSELLAFVSWKGVHFTDGFSVTTLTNELDWEQILSRTSTSTPIALINDPENLDLIFYYRNDSFTTDTYRALHFSYAPRHVGLRGNIASHQAGGVLKVSGPVFMRNYDIPTSAYADLKSAWAVPRINGDTTVFLGYGGSEKAAGAGRIYKETGSSIPAKDQAMKFTTRRMFLAGEGQEFKMNEVYTYCANLTTGAASGQVIKLTPETIKTNDGAGTSGLVTQGPYYATAVGKLFKHQVWQAAEGMRLTWEVTATGAATHADVAANWLILDGSDFGLEDAGT